MHPTETRTNLFGEIAITLEPITFKFYVFTNKCIKQINAGKVQIKTQGIHRAAMITAAEQPSDDDAVMTIILMPMMQY